MAKASQIVGVHLDLKGVMFKPSYIPTLLADLADQGINTVLIEYEDIFPFKGWDFAWDKSVTWSSATLKKFLAEAAKRKIEVIPLQQCLGHLEYIYRWDRYRSFAENRKYPSTVKLSNRKAKAQVFDLLEQVIAAHPDSRYVHLGMDEAHALVTAAEAKGKDVVDVFISYLHELCDICEAHGKKPIVWSDMLEDHFKPGVWDSVKDRVVLMPWDYGSTGEEIHVGRISGWRYSKKWLDEPANPQAPTIGSGHTFIEDMPAGSKKAVGKNLKGRAFTSMFQADMWQRLGFEVMGASAVRSSSHLAVLPRYNHVFENVRAWSRACHRTNISGQIGTSWARGTSWCPPGMNIDVIWPAITELARTMGATPKAFWKGVPDRTVMRIMETIGRCRDDWRIEKRVIAEMNALLPKIKTHQHEWKSILLMLETLASHREMYAAVDEVEFFHANNRPVDSEWQRRIDDQARLLKVIAAKRKEIKAHFGKRYHGDSFEEWVRDLFDLWETKLKDCQKISRTKKAVAKKQYAGK